MAELHLAQTDSPAGEELTDDQIEQLLQQAEERVQRDAGHKSRSAATRWIPKAREIELSPSMKPYIKNNGEVALADSTRLLDDDSKRLANASRKIEDPVAAKRTKLDEKKSTAGQDWFNLPRTNLTPELKRDLQLIRMRSVLDPKKFYKKENTKAKPPEFSQVGTVIEGPTDFFSGRIPKRERKRTLMEEVLAGESETGRFRKKYLDLQAAKTSGKKAHYKQRMAKKYGSKFKR